ncbi:MAG: peptidylprolyl isomerase [Rubrivivax sp.]|jgi:cyclophilin family peptidyl-prolyl cis-trans isomerase|nr:peptidylprolyl isomerase [Rubrivivax sp.]
MTRIAALCTLAVLQGAASGGALAQSRPAVVELQTNLGTIAVQLDYAKAPITADNFVAYVSSGFYRNTLIHRSVPGFVVQGGGFNRADGKLKATQPPIVNEASNGLSNRRATIAMARTSSPNSATSQFFVNLVDNPGLDFGSASNPSGYAVFGRVVKGMNVVDAIAALPRFSDLPYTAPGSLVWIEATYRNTNWSPSTVSRTRITLSGSGTVTSVPAGLNCGSTCSLSQAPGSALQLKAVPASGHAFGGWRGDCRGERTTLNIDTTKGNHNCTAVFLPLGPSLQ